jgi:cyclopropane fatty-acyl-phospholipid synthase-like methyltransferase
MNFFDDIDNINEYINMSMGYDGKELIEKLRLYLKPGSTLLELGMGPGKDLDILAETYKVTGSDFSTLFIDLYRKSNPEADLLRLDAIELKTDRKFDSIYSNKVLHHIKEDELEESFKNQLKILNEEGLIFHTFWLGDKEENHHGLRFIYYTHEKLMKLIPDSFELIKSEEYGELKENDSFYVILRKRKG